MAGDLRATYRGYLDCLDRGDWDGLGRFVDEAVVRNGRPLGLAGYRAMLEGNRRDIPDLRYPAELVIAEPPHLAARILFDCHPAGRFLGLAVDGRRVRFAENVLYRFAGDRIAEVWSLIDRAAIETQLGVGQPGAE